MLEKYKTVYQGGEGETVEKKVKIHCDGHSGKDRRRGDCVYRKHEEKSIGMQRTIALPM